MPKYPLNIFLPTAGLGERLRPITNQLPKPLLPILGRPIIAGILEKLTAVCDGRIGVNLHWKAELIRAWAAKSPWADRFTFFSEDPILGTGGALKNAATFLSDGHFIVHNSDILLDIDFSRLIGEHLSSGNTATLVCHRIPHLSNVVIDANGQVVDVENPGDSRPDPSTAAEKVAYTGVAVYAPEILQFLPSGVSHATVAWIAASQAGRRVRVFDVTGCYWNDVGNPVTYARGIIDALQNEGESVHVPPDARVGAVESDGYVVFESGSEARSGSRVRNCIIMPGAVVSGEHEDRILGPGYEVSLSETDMQPSFAVAERKRVTLSDPLFALYFGIATTDERGVARIPLSQSAPQGGKGIGEGAWSDAILIGIGGSDRRYFRIRSGDSTAVLMECTEKDPDFERHLVYTEYFSLHSVPVPKLLAADHDRKRALFEDLGDTSLYSLLKFPLEAGRIEALYRSVLDIAVKLHTSATKDIANCPLLGSRVFDLDHMRWETNYFLEQFVTGLRRVEIKNRRALEQEFDWLARKVDAYPRTVIHRDFQCQNIMVRNSVPRVIDYQGGRMAPPAYDIASILWDPYHRLDDKMRERLLGHYLGEMKKHSERFDEQAFLDSLLPCRLQRHMQALGAYGFLSVVKGKKYFLKHVVEAMRMLKEEAATVKSDYPELYRIITGLI